MDTAQWHFGRNGVQGGPVGEAEIVRMIKAGELQRTDLVWSPGMPRWVTPTEVPAFAAAMAQAIVPPPIQVPPLPPVGTSPPPTPVGYASPMHPYSGMPQRDIGQDAGMRMLLPVGRSGWAIASGYCGLLSVFPFIGCLFGIAAVLTGLMALADMRRNPQRHGMGRAIFGIIVGTLFALIWGVGFIAFISSR